MRDAALRQKNVGGDPIPENLCDPHAIGKTLPSYSVAQARCGASTEICRRGILSPTTATTFTLSQGTSFLQNRLCFVFITCVYLKVSVTIFKLLIFIDNYKNVPFEISLIVSLWLVMMQVIYRSLIGNYLIGELDLN